MKRRLLFFIFLLLCAFTPPIYAETYTIEDDFDGCDYGKIYTLTNGQYLRCQSYKYFYKYRPKVIAHGRKVIAIDERDVRGEIVDGTTIQTRIDGDWDGCNFDVHPLTNGMHLVCSSYFFAYGYMTNVEIIVIDGNVEAVRINGELKDGISVVNP